MDASRFSIKLEKAFSLTQKAHASPWRYPYPQKILKDIRSGGGMKLYEPLQQIGERERNSEQ